jgi:hypothetical protein
MDDGKPPQTPSWLEEYQQQYHRKDCQCERCQQERLRRYQQRHGYSPAHGMLIFAGTVIALLLILVLAHACWVDTHCTMVLGTQVCQ